MGIPCKIERLVEGQKISAKAWNRLIDLVYSMKISVVAPLRQLDTPGGSVLSVDAPITLQRMTISSTPDSSHPEIVLAKKRNGSNTYGDDIPVLGVQGHADNDEILAALPAGGLPGDPQYGGNAVLWVEYLILPVSKSRYQVLQVTDTAGHLAVDSVRLEGSL